MIEYMYMYMYIYKSVNFLKSHDNLLGITYRIKIMLNGIAITKQPETPFISFFVQLHFIKRHQFLVGICYHLYKDIIRLNLIAS